MQELPGETTSWYNQQNLDRLSNSIRVQEKNLHHSSRIFNSNGSSSYISSSCSIRWIDNQVQNITWHWSSIEFEDWRLHRKATPYEGFNFHAVEGILSIFSGFWNLAKSFQKTAVKVFGQIKVKRISSISVFHEHRLLIRTLTKTSRSRSSCISSGRYIGIGCPWKHCIVWKTGGT